MMARNPEARPGVLLELFNYRACRYEDSGGGAITKLAAKLGRNPAPFSALIRNMEQDGEVARNVGRPPSSRRTFNLQLTTLGFSRAVKLALARGLIDELLDPPVQLPVPTNWDEPAYGGDCTLEHDAPLAADIEDASEEAPTELTRSVRATHVEHYERKRSDQLIAYLQNHTGFLYSRKGGIEANVTKILAMRCEDDASWLLRHMASDGLIARRAWSRTTFGIAVPASIDELDQLIARERQEAPPHKRGGNKKDSSRLDDDELAA
jgi:hypothetical protein